MVDGRKCCGLVQRARSKEFVVELGYEFIEYGGEERLSWKNVIG